MPTLARLGNVLIRIYGEDHVPPHFHVVTPDGEAMVRIEDLQVHAGSIDRKSLRVAINGPRRTSNFWKSNGGA